MVPLPVEVSAWLMARLPGVVPVLQMVILAGRLMPVTAAAQQVGAVTVLPSVKVATLSFRRMSPAGVAPTVSSALKLATALVAVPSSTPWLAPTPSLLSLHDALPI